MTEEKMKSIMDRLMPMGGSPDDAIEAFVRAEVLAAGGRLTADICGQEDYRASGDPDFLWLAGFTILLDGTVWVVDLSGPSGTPVYYTAEVGDDIEVAFREALGDETFVR